MAHCGGRTDYTRRISISLGNEEKQKGNDTSHDILPENTIPKHNKTKQE
jgi:hypothetical protein